MLLTRLRYKYLSFRDWAKQLNRRAAVEQHLWDCYHDKRALPSKEECREMALKLGCGHGEN